MTVIMIVMTSYAPISSKIELSGATKPTDDARNLRRIGSFKEIGFYTLGNYAVYFLLI